MRCFGFVLVSCTVFVACRDRPAGPADATIDVAVPVAAVSASASAAAPLDGRELPRAATFGDLVGVASALAKAEKSASTAGCNLRLLADKSHRFEASIASGPFGTAPKDLDDLLAKNGIGILVATSFGMIGTGDGITLQPLTPLPKSATSNLVPALFITDRGVYLRLAMHEGMRITNDDRGPMPESDITRVKKELVPHAAAMVVTAEADVPLTQVREVLGWLDGAVGPVVLAVPLGKDVKVPKKSAETKTALGADGCPGGADLMDIPKGSTAGSYEGSSLTKLKDFTDDAMSCSSKLPPASAGGHMKLDVRIEPDGKVSKACFTKDEIGDAALRACVLARTKAYVFPKPDVAGIVNYGTELSFTPPGFANQALCK